MIGLGLLESLAAVVLESVVLAALLAQLVTTVRLAATAWEIQERVFHARQAEDLILTALTRAGEGIEAEDCVRSASATSLEVAADLDGDRRVDAGSAEITALVVEREAARARLVHRMGRQSMTILTDLASNARLLALDRHGLPAGSTQLVALIGLDQDGDDVARGMGIGAERYGLGCR